MNEGESNGVSKTMQDISPLHAIDFCSSEKQVAIEIGINVLAGIPWTKMKRKSNCQRDSNIGFEIQN